MAKKQNNKYWRDRIKAEMDAKDKDDISLERAMKQLHDFHYREIEKEIDSFYQRYAEKEGMDIQAAKRAVSDADLNAYQKKAKELVAKANRMREQGIKVTKANFTHQENVDMAIYNLKMKVKADELLLLNIDLAAHNLAIDEYKTTKDFLDEGFRKELKFQSGLLGLSVASKEKINTLAEATINANFKGSRWSDKIWERQEELRNIINQECYKAIVRGKNAENYSSKLKSFLKNEIDVSSGYARRLAITEHARVQMEVGRLSMVENGFNGFDIIPEPRACDTCKDIAKKGPFSLEKWETGSYAPPFHPHCRCAVVGEDIDKKDKSDKIEYEIADDKIEKELDKQSNKVFKKLLYNQKSALVDYTNNYHKQINEYLRGIVANDDVLGWVGDLADNVDKALESSKIGKDLVLYRGVSQKEFELLKENDSWNTFLSTSINKDVASGFGTEDYGGSGFVVEIQAPSNTKGMYLGHHSSVSHEKEMLLQRNQKYKILSSSENELKIEVLP